MASNAVQDEPGDSTGNNYYAVAVGCTIGIFLQWCFAKESTDKFPKNIHQRFDTCSEATDFLTDNGVAKDSIKVYIDKDQVLDLCDFVVDTDILDTTDPVIPAPEDTTDLTDVTSDISLAMPASCSA